MVPSSFGFLSGGSLPTTSCGSPWYRWCCRSRTSYRRCSLFNEYLYLWLEAAAPEALDSLTPEERRQWYKILRLRADVRAGGTLEVSWAEDPEGKAVCEAATLSW